MAFSYLLRCGYYNPIGFFPYTLAWRRNRCLIINAKKKNYRFFNFFPATAQREQSSGYNSCLKLNLMPHAEIERQIEAPLHNNL